MQSEDLSFFVTKAPKAQCNHFGDLDVLTISLGKTAIKFFMLTHAYKQESTNFKNNLLWAFEGKKKKE